MNKIDSLITKSFIGPSIMSFFIATFVLVMQFLWKYIDEILGKGFTIFELLELIFYYSVTLVPLSVPITVLISSVMIYGDMAEKYELAAMKSAGVSLLRIMLPGILIACSIGAFSIFSSNYLKPAANFQFQKRFLAIRKQKTALAIEQRIFNEDFNETVIRIDKIAKDGQHIQGVLIYDHTENDKSLINFLHAQSGSMFTADNGRLFVMQLDTGIQYKELAQEKKLGETSTSYPFVRTEFDGWTKTLDMSVFETEDGLFNFNGKKEDMLDGFKLKKSIDSFNISTQNNLSKISDRTQEIIKQWQLQESLQSTRQELRIDSASLNTDTTDIYKNNNLNTENKNSLKQKKDSLVQSWMNAKTNVPRQSKHINYSDEEKKATTMTNNDVPKLNSSSIEPRIIKAQLDTNDSVINKPQYVYLSLDSIKQRDVMIRAQTLMSRDRDQIITFSNANKDNYVQKQKYLLRLNQQFSWAFICIVFLFIGASLGSIIRKGGYGYPLLVAILFYMIFIISTIMGEKLVRNDTYTGVEAAWLPCILLMPFAAILTYVALKDVKFKWPSIFLFRR